MKERHTTDHHRRVEVLAEGPLTAADHLWVDNKVVRLCVKGCDTREVHVTQTLHTLSVAITTSELFVNRSPTPVRLHVWGPHVGLCVKSVF